jgi:hypothetical protein
VAHIVVITHRYDDFSSEDYLLRCFFAHWEQAGHRVTVAAGLDGWPAGDAAILHVDLSVVPAAYAEASKRYPRVVNGRALDIRKRHVSRHLVKRGDGWLGPVIVKTDLNCNGAREARLLRRMERDGVEDKQVPRGALYMDGDYPVYASPAEVQETGWTHPGLVVERFRPEQDERGYWMRAWVFFGERERCTRYLGDQAIIKSRNIVAKEPAEVPEALRAERRRLGLDYGKLDFVINDGEAVLLDANRTPGAPPASAEMEISNADLAQGLDSMLKRP